MRRFLFSSAITACLLILGLSAPAEAQVTKAWVSGQGTDAAGCGASTSPCRTLQYAHNLISAGGEIDVLDSAGYSALTITKAITIVNTGSTATVPSITINAGASDAISLNGLTLDGFGTAQRGIMLTSGGGLTISNCGVMNFNNEGIDIVPSSGTTTVAIANTIVSGANNAGINLSASGSAKINGVISQTLASGNAIGIAFGPNSSALIDDSVVSGSLDFGLYTNGGTIRLSRSVVTANNYGIYIGGGSVTSYGDNRINGNATDITGTLTSVATR